MKQHRRHGAPFWTSVHFGPSCWEWMGARQGGSGGHGRKWDRLAGKARPTHRIAWESEYGAVPDGLEVCHRCDNPPCVRPDHLFLGTHAENMADMDRKGRRVNPSTLKTHCKRGHALSGSNLYTNRYGKRVCAECRRALDAKYREQRKVAHAQA